MPLHSKKKKKGAVFTSFVMSCLGASLLASAFGTEYWFVSDAESVLEGNTTRTGNVYFGLFSGRNEFKAPPRLHTLHVVCLDGDCMYSCADTKENREKQLNMILDGETEGLKVDCQREQEVKAQPLMMANAILGRDGVQARQTHLQSLVQSRSGLSAAHNEELEREGDVRATETTTESPTDDLEFMDFGLWVGTITCLSAGLLMAVVGALFAVVNTATTPVEAITGVPGLYLWNGLAALFDMLTVILWAVQFHKHLTHNVLLYDANDGWTTEGMEVFGYSFWLVVVAIFVHVANIAIIAIGTYEPKKKTQLEAPDSKGGNIMLY